MKERHKESERFHARQTLLNLGIPVGADFHTLNNDRVVALLEAADRVRYQKPKNANGSRARYFHDLLQRRAQMKV